MNIYRYCLYLLNKHLNFVHNHDECHLLDLYLILDVVLLLDLLDYIDILLLEFDFVDLILH